MSGKISFLCLGLLCCWLFSGCATSSRITNLTPSQLLRTESGQYLFEAAFDADQRLVPPETINAYVVVGQDFYPMRRAPVLKGRWETMVPIAREQRVLYYQYKFDYEYLSMPQRRSTSQLSPLYQLDVLDK